MPAKVVRSAIEAEVALSAPVADRSVATFASAPSGSPNPEVAPVITARVRSAEQSPLLAVRILGS